jgi:hypothetical protein
MLGGIDDVLFIRDCFCGRARPINFAVVAPVNRGESMNHHVIEWDCRNPECGVRLQAKMETQADTTGVTSFVGCPVCATEQNPLPAPAVAFQYDDGSGWKDALEI